MSDTSDPDKKNPDPSHTGTGTPDANHTQTDRPDPSGLDASATSGEEAFGGATDDWSAALAEQAAGAPPSQADGLKGLEDEWSQALAEQTTASSAGAGTHASAGQVTGVNAPHGAEAAPGVFQPLVDIGQKTSSDIDLILDIPVQLSVELGRTRMTIKNILQLGQGSVIELDGLAGEPMDIYVNGYLIAQGEVVVVDDRYGIRLTDIITPADRLNRLNNRR